MKEWQYVVTEGDWTVRASYEEPDNVQILHRGEVFRTITHPAYKIWNIAAHFRDYIPELDASLKEDG